MASLLFQVAGGKEVNLEKEFNFLLSSDIEHDEESSAAAAGTAGPKELAQKLAASGLPAFSDVGSFVGSEEFGRWFRSATPEDGVPNGMWKKVSEAAEVDNMYQLLAVSSFRRDRFVAAANRFVLNVMGTHFYSETEMNLAKIVEEEVKPTNPVLMCSVLGFDASDRVQDLASQCNKPITSIAIGSEEGFSQAEKSINTAIKSGRWVLVKLSSTFGSDKCKDLRIQYSFYKTL